MISLRNIWAGDRSDNQGTFIIKNLDCDLIPGRHMNILCPNTKTRDIFFKVLCGIIHPEHGEIMRRSTISWPIGWLGLFHKNLTVLQNMHFLADTYGLSRRTMREYVEDFTGLAPLIKQKFALCPGYVKTLFAFATTCALPFDFYIGFDHIVAGQKKHHRKCQQRIDELMTKRTFVILSTNHRCFERFPNDLFFLGGGRLWGVDSLEDLSIIANTMPNN